MGDNAKIRHRQQCYNADLWTTSDIESGTESLSEMLGIEPHGNGNL